MDCYLDSFSKDNITKVIKENGFKTFKFGGDEVKISIDIVTCPCTTVGKQIQIKSDIVNNGIPLLD